MSAETRILACCGGMVVVSGMERMTFDLLRSLSEHGAEVHCVLNSWGNSKIRPLVDAVGASWSTGRYLVPLSKRTLHPLRLVGFVWDVLVTSAGLWRDSGRFRPTHVLVAETFSVVKNAPALLALRACGIPVILRVPNAPERTKHQEWLWRLVVAPCVTTLVTNSEFSRARVLECGVPARKVELIQNRVARPTHTPTEGASPKLTREATTLLTVGQIAPFKGTHLAVEASCELLDAGDDVQLVVLGTIPVAGERPTELVSYMERLRATAHERGHGSRIHFLGDRDDVLDWMRGSHLLVAPILQEETFGNVVLEAKSTGLPVVTFPRGGLPELVEHRVTGFLCETNDVEGLVAGIRFFLEDPEKHHAAREASLRFFDDPSHPYDAERFATAWRRVFSMEAVP